MQRKARSRHFASDPVDFDFRCSGTNTDLCTRQTLLTRESRVRLFHVGGDERVAGCVIISRPARPVLEGVLALFNPGPALRL